jgi:hypothetical protein
MDIDGDIDGPLIGGPHPMGAGVGVAENLPAVLAD